MHGYGDQLLCQLGQRLAGVVGDDFAILLPSIGTVAARRAVSSHRSCTWSLTPRSPRCARRSDSGRRMPVSVNLSARNLLDPSSPPRYRTCSLSTRSPRSSLRSG